MSALVNFLLSLVACFLFALKAAPCYSADQLLRFIPLQRATLLDEQSRLEWTRSDNGHDIDWQRAARLCGELPGQWRLPHVAELIALYDAATAGTVCGGARCHVPASFELTGDWFWSADSVGSDGSDGDELAWGVLLANGARTQSVKVLGEGSRALCVRAAGGPRAHGARATESKQPGPLDARSSIALPIDAGHSAVIFSWSHRGFSHPLARLEQLQGAVLWDRTDLAGSSVQATLPLAGLRTGNDALDQRLRGPDFFDASAYPVVTFKSTKITARAATNEFTLVGVLTVHGISQPVTLLARINKAEDVPGESPWTGFDADGVLRRSDFGLSRYVPMVADEIAVHITLEAHAE
jgi:polyisoprenoid-binding protein YceI